MDVKVSLSSRGIAPALIPPEDPLPQGVAQLTEQQKYGALYIKRNHIHPDLKSEYLMEESPSNMWRALKTRYERQKAVILPEATHGWTHLRLQDFKCIEDFNHAVHKICSKLRFCEKEPSEVEKIEKTLSTMLPADRILQQQYRARDYQIYSELIHVLLQAEKHDELLLKNSHQCPVGTAPLPEVHANFQKNNEFNGQFNGQNKNFNGNRNRNKKNTPHNSDRGKGVAWNKFDKTNLCQKCGCYKHITKKCCIPKHLVNLYLQSMGRNKPAQGARYEAHFNLQPGNNMEVGCSQDVQGEPSNTKKFHLPQDFKDTENMMIEYASNDVFEDFH
ncbi:hypothetical protein ZWY2020_038763 [Hordeum vulgare]|nr:hypothetical protein ZWY2020_038763 [Hordeum vulgare]